MTAHELTTPSDREIKVVREFDAPRDQVFAAYTDPELIPQWWGPHGTETIVDEMDPQTGGRWRFISRDGEGNEYAFRGAYREVAPPERIVQTFEFEPMAGHVSVETATFEDLGDRTRVTTVSIFHTPEERDGMLQSGMEGGMSETYERLDALLAKLVAR